MQKTAGCPNPERPIGCWQEAVDSILTINAGQRDLPALSPIEINQVGTTCKDMALVILHNALNIKRPSYAGKVYANQTIFLLTEESTVGSHP
jgi:hypothetical protein